jgi:hypothetical protein
MPAASASNGYVRPTSGVPLTAAPRGETMKSSVEAARHFFTPPVRKMKFPGWRKRRG